ncbi:hypothetical protein KPL70_021175 [Citrus sinensis]|nr:hypothetical protein KPL70_021175 [Citrus sinensis]
MLKYISLSSNFVSGSIPRELCNSESLVEINLDGNLLSGTIEDLVLGNNHIHGSIPEYLSELPLVVLDLDSNNFTGIIPLNLSYNKLDGELPSSLSHILNLRLYNFLYQCDKKTTKRVKKRQEVPLKCEALFKLSLKFVNPIQIQVLMWEPKLNCIMLASL